jgi:hypothetical protein
LYARIAEPSLLSQKENKLFTKKKDLKMILFAVRIAVGHGKTPGVNSRVVTTTGSDDTDVATKEESETALPFFSAHGHACVFS